MKNVASKIIVDDVLLAKSHVGSLIVDDSYKVGRSIGVPITGSILKL